MSDEALLERLVAFDTTSRLSNLPLVDFVADYLDRPGVEAGTTSASPDGAKANLVVRTRARHGGRRRSHPLGPHGRRAGRRAGLALRTRSRSTRAGETYVGRGTADMKGFLALAINRLAALDPARARRPLALLLTYDEEVGTLGARRFAETRPTLAGSRAT